VAKYTFKIERTDPPGEHPWGMPFDTETLDDLPAFTEGLAIILQAVVGTDTLYLENKARLEAKAEEDADGDEKRA